MNPDRVSQVIQFALAKAGREDFGFGDLGVIHLVKLLFLADYAFSQGHGGETFTGIQWVFHHFGPWNKEAWSQTTAVLEDPGIEPRAHLAGAFEKKTFRFRDRREGDEIFYHLERLLPHEVTRAVSAAVHEYGSDTKRLLHYVYKTPPMRAAIPGEPIDFSELPGGDLPPFRPAQSEAPSISNTQKRKEEEVRARLRESIAAKAATRQIARINPYPPLNEKEVEALDEITRLLSEDEDQAPLDLHGELVFSPEFWQSDFRREHGLP